jgi:hypothetical protein
MAVVTQKALSSPRFPAEELKTLAEAQEGLRDVVALSTLPAIWTGASVERIAESLLAAMETTIRPVVSFIRVLRAGDASHDVFDLAFLRGQVADPVFTALLASRICDWAALHEPDETLESFLEGEQTLLRICAYPLGRDCSEGVLAAGFLRGADGRSRPTPLQRMLLNIAAKSRRQCTPKPGAPGAGRSRAERDTGTL